MSDLDRDWIRDSLDRHPADHPASRFLGKEFLLWLWWSSERGYGSVDLDHFGKVDAWIDDRLQFTTGGDEPQAVDLKGGAPAATMEARTALQAGKVVEVARIGLRVKEREYALQLLGETLEITGLKVPGEVKDGVDERIYERMFLLEEATALVDALFFRFCAERLGKDWDKKILPMLRTWVAETRRGTQE
jgi:hypothetical protein